MRADCERVGDWAIQGVSAVTENRSKWGSCVCVCVGELELRGERMFLSKSLQSELSQPS